MISKSQVRQGIKEEKTHVLPQYWEQGYKIVGCLGSTFHKEPWKTPIRRGQLRKKNAQRMMASLIKSDPSLRYQLRLEQATPQEQKLRVTRAHDTEHIHNPPTV